MSSPYKLRSSYFGSFEYNSKEAKCLSHSYKIHGIFYRQRFNHKSFWVVRLIQGNSITIIVSENALSIIGYNIPLAILFGGII